MTQEELSELLAEHERRMRALKAYFNELEKNACFIGVGE